MDFLTLSSRILDDALQMGAEEAEVFARMGRSSDLKMAQGRVESITTAEEEGLGVRFRLPGGRWGYCTTVDPSAENLQGLMEEAFRCTEAAPATDDAEPLPGPHEEELPEPEDLGIWSPEIPRASLSRKIEILRALESAAQQAHSSVTWVDTVLYHDGWTRTHLRNSRGLHAEYRRTQAHVILNVLAGRAGDSVLSHHEAAACSLEELDPAVIGKAAGLRAALPLGGKRFKPRRVAVVLDAPVAAELLESLAPSFLGENHRRGRSLFSQEALDTPVASSRLHIVDEGRLHGGLFTAPFDGEGSPTGRTVLVEEGVLRALLHDRSSAARAGTRSTGNATRRSYRDPPRPGVTNLQILPGDQGTQELLLDVDQAFHVLNLTRVGGINPVTGSFSVAASGVWMERGRDVHPMGGVTLAGDLGRMLRSVVAVGDDTSWHHGDGAFGSPTLVVEGMTVAG